MHHFDNEIYLTFYDLIFTLKKLVLKYSSVTKYYNVSWNSIGNYRTKYVITEISVLLKLNFCFKMLLVVLIYLKHFYYPQYL